MLHVGHMLRSAHMSKLILVRNVPDDVHRQLKAKAAAEGISLSEFMLRLATRVAERPTESEMLERLRNLPPVPPVEGSGTA
jgi:hypothetical protein